MLILLVPVSDREEAVSIGSILQSKRIDTLEEYVVKYDNQYGYEAILNGEDPSGMNVLLSKVINNYVLTPKRTIKVLISDLDSTLIDNETIDEMANFAGPEIERKIKVQI